MTIFITGTTGFVGSALVQHLHQQDYSVRASVRIIDNRLPPTFQQELVGDLLPNTNWSSALNDLDPHSPSRTRPHTQRPSH